MTAAANSRKHTGNRKSQPRVMKHLQPLLQTMALDGGCHSGGRKKVAWNVGDVIKALWNEYGSGMVGPLLPPIIVPYQINLQQQCTSPLVKIQETYA